MLYNIKFPPGSIKGVLADAIQMTMGHSTKQYKYDESGSTIEFSPDQLKAVVSYLQENKKYAKSDPEAFGDMLPEIDEALAIIRDSVMQSKNIAQAALTPDQILEKCSQFLTMALRK